MDIYIPLSIFLILLNILSNKNAKSRNAAFVFSFICVFLFAALRYCFGPDYFSYWNIYDEIKQYGLGNRAEGEPIFYYYLQSFPNYTSFIITNSFLWFAIYYAFFKKYVDSKYYWILLFYLLFTETCVIDALVAMRSAMCAFIFILAYFALIKKKRWLFLLCITVSVFIHTSSIALLPLVLFSIKKESFLFNKKFVYFVCAFSVIMTFKGHNYLMTLLSQAIVDNVEDLSKYAHYIDDMGSTSSILRHLILKLLTIIPLLHLANGARKENDEEYILIYKLGMLVPIIALIIGQGMMSRYFMILNPFFIVSVVRSFMCSKKEYSVISVLCIIVSNLFIFANSISADYNYSLWIYRSIFSAPVIP